MTRTSILLMVAAAALAGCNEDHTIVAGSVGGDDNAAAATNTPVVLPPSIASSKIYRCADNDVVYVDWLSDGSANIRTEQSGIPTHVAATEAGQPMTAAGGYSLSGTSGAPTVRMSVPGQAAETCKA